MKTPDRTPAETLEIACRRTEWLEQDIAKTGRLATTALVDLQQGHYAMAQVSLSLLKTRAADLSRQVDAVLANIVALTPSVDGGQDD